MLTTYFNYQQIMKDVGKALQRTEKEPSVKRETEYYLANISKVKTIEEFVKDTRLFNYAMKAHGLGNMSYAKAFMVKAMKEGIDDKNSFANKLTDKRYQDFVKTFDFKTFGEITTGRTRAQQGTVDMYMRQTLEENAGKDNEGVRLALYFERKAKGLTNFYQILADPALSRVLRTALDLPDSFARSDIDAQVKFFEKKLDIKDFSDPKKLSAFLQRFTNLWDLSNPAQLPQSSMSVLFARPTEYGVSTNLLFSIQSLRR